MTRTISLPALGLKRLSVSYKPASAADAELIDAAITNGSTSLPAYLIRVVPQMKVDDSVLAEGPAVTMGDQQYWTARLAGPISASNGDVPFEHTVAGDLLVFSIDGGGIGGSAAVIRRGASLEPNAAEDLHFAGLSFWTAHNLTDRLTRMAWADVSCACHPSRCCPPALRLVISSASRGRQVISAECSTRDTSRFLPLLSPIRYAKPS